MERRPNDFAWGRMDIKLRVDMALMLIAKSPTKRHKLANLDKKIVDVLIGSGLKFA